VITFIETSSEPVSLMTSDTCVSTAASSSASTIAVLALPPAERISSATLSSFSCVRPQRNTVAPSRAKA
jgi:hypothetical protein